MSLSITVAGTSYPVPSNASDTDWAAQQVAFLQALAAQLAVGPAVQRLSANVTPVGTGADTTEDDLMTYSLPSGTLSASGMGVRVTCWGTGVNTSDLTTVRCYFGATAVLTQNLTASQANTWRAVFEVVRSGATSQLGSGLIVNGGTATTYTEGISAPSETLAGAVTIKCTGQRAVSSVANSVRQLGMLVELIP